MTQQDYPPDFRALCAELLEALENAIRVIYNEDGTKHISTADPVIAKADAALAQPEPESSITFSESGDPEVMRVDRRGFHYRGELIEDAGLAHRLMVTYLQRHTSMHPEVVEREDAR
jgi:hypothetical protein